MMATNNDWAITTNKNDRRFCICDVSPEKHKDYAYFSALDAEMKTKATKQAFIYDMLTRDISKYVPGDIPVTEGLKEQRAQSLPSVWQWWRDCLEREYVSDTSTNGQLWFDVEASSILHASFVKWCNEIKYQDEFMKLTNFGREFSKVYPKKRDSSGVKYTIGYPDSAEKTFKEYFGI